MEIELLQVALGNRSELSRTPTAKEWNAIYQFAEEQAIVGVLFGGVKRLPKHQFPEMDLLMEWVGQVEYIKTQNKRANADCEKVTKVFRDAGFKTSIMKGQGNSRFYKADVLNVLNGKECIDLSMTRTCGDIDLWVDDGTLTGSACNFEKVNTFVQKLYPTKEINELEIQLRGVVDTPVEVHYRPFIMRNPWTNRRLQRFFAEEAESCFGNGLYTTVRFNLVHQLAHVRLHLFTEGIGMKQLVDYYFLLLHNTEDKHELMSIIDHLGMKRFAEAMMWVMKEVFLLPEDNLLCSVDEKGGRLLIQDVMNGGNFGRSDDSLKERKQSRGYGLWALLVRNLRYSRFDSWDWICGPLWRIYHRIWRKIKGYK